MADASHSTTTVLLIDVSGLFWAAFHATADQHVSEAFDRTVGAVRWLASEDEGLVAVCLDMPPYHRSKLLPTYKAQRAAAPPMAVEQFERVKDRLRADGFLLWGSPGFEADDVIAWAVSEALRDPGVSHITIASNDKDLHQLIGDRVSCFAPMTKTMYREPESREKFGVHPSLLLDYLALVGDTSDNVPGVPGVGPKTAAALIGSFGSLAAVLEEARKPDGESKLTKPKLKASLVEHAEAAWLSRSVIELRTDVPLQWSEIRMEREVKPLSNPGNVDEPDLELDPTPTTPVAQAQVVERPTARAEMVIEQPQMRSTALAPVTVDWSLALEPATLSAAHKLAQYLHDSRLYVRFPNAEAIWAVIIRGREMGLGAMAALDNFHIIEGRPSPFAHLLIARAQAHPDCEYLEYAEGDDTFAVYETKSRRRPKPTVLRYTLEQAQRAGVCPAEMRALPPPNGGKDSRSNWEKRPDEMLRKTCGVQLARAVYPSATQGLYAIEELGGQ